MVHNIWFTFCQVYSGSVTCYFYVWIFHRIVPVTLESTLWDFIWGISNQWSEFLLLLHTFSACLVCCCWISDIFFPVHSIHVNTMKTCLSVYVKHFIQSRCKWSFLSLLYHYGNTTWWSICLSFLPFILSIDYSYNQRMNSVVYRPGGEGSARQRGKEDSNCRVSAGAVLLARGFACWQRTVSMDSLHKFGQSAALMRPVDKAWCWSGTTEKKNGLEASLLGHSVSLQIVKTFNHGDLSQWALTQWFAGQRHVDIGRN